MKYSRNGSTRSLKALCGEGTPYSRSLSQISPIRASILAERLVSAMRRSTSSLSWSWAAMGVLLGLGWWARERPPGSLSSITEHRSFCSVRVRPYVSFSHRPTYPGPVLDKLEGSLEDAAA